MLLGTDVSFPPADSDPLRSLKEAEFSAQALQKICTDNPSALFGLSGA